MSASHMNGANRSHRSNVGVEKRWTDDGSNQMSVTVTSYRRCAAVSDSKSWHALLSGSQYRIDRIPQTLTETDSYENVLRSQHFDFVLQIPAAADWRLGIEPKRQ